jgi:hypothetical protein
MAERVAPEAMDKVRLGDVLRRRELLDLRAATMTDETRSPPNAGAEARGM